MPPVWMQAVFAPALARYREAPPGVDLALRTAPFRALEETVRETALERSGRSAE